MLEEKTALNIEIDIHFRYVKVATIQQKFVLLKHEIKLKVVSYI